MYKYSYATVTTVGIFIDWIYVFVVMQVMLFNNRITVSLQNFEEIFIKDNYSCFASFTQIYIFLSSTKIFIIPEFRMAN